MESHIPPHAKTGRPRDYDRKIINGIIHVLTTRCRWDDMPKEPKREEKLGNSDTKLTKEKSKEEKFVITVGIVEELRQKGDSRPPWEGYL